MRSYPSIIDDDLGIDKETQMLKSLIVNDACNKVGY